jgi:hypothetical protein
MHACSVAMATARRCRPAPTPAIVPTAATTLGCTIWCVPHAAAPRPTHAAIPSAARAPGGSGCAGHASMVWPTCKQPTSWHVLRHPKVVMTGTRTVAESWRLVCAPTMQLAGVCGRRWLSEALVCESCLVHRGRVASMPGTKAPAARLHKLVRWHVALVRTAQR